MKNITTEIRIDIFIAKEYFFFLREMIFGIGSPRPLFFAVGIICYNKGQYFFCQTVWYLAETVKAEKTSEFMDKLVKDWERCLLGKWVPPLIAVAAFNLDFLCIHPFRDGNGRGKI